MTTTRTPRREQLLVAAADLFAGKGFHAVGIDEIGEAAGITGPGVYRHFPSKQALLETLCDRTMDRMLGAVQGVDDLDRLVDLHVDLVVGNQALIGVWVRERRAVGDDVRRSLRRRMRDYEQVWRDALSPQRPDLGAAELALTVGSALAMLNTTSLIDSPLPAVERSAVLRRLALAALLSTD